LKHGDTENTEKYVRRNAVFSPCLSFQDQTLHKGHREGTSSLEETNLRVLRVSVFISSLDNIALHLAPPCRQVKKLLKHGDTENTEKYVRRNAVFSPCLSFQDQTLHKGHREGTSFLEETNLRVLRASVFISSLDNIGLHLAPCTLHPLNRLRITP
jgi:hypothetical protein